MALFWVLLVVVVLVVIHFVAGASKKPRLGGKLPVYLPGRSWPFVGHLFRFLAWEQDHCLPYLEAGFKDTGCETYRADLPGLPMQTIVITANPGKLSPSPCPHHSSSLRHSEALHLHRVWYQV